MYRERLQGLAVLFRSHPSQNQHVDRIANKVDAAIRLGRLNSTGMLGRENRIRVPGTVGAYRSTSQVDLVTNRTRPASPRRTTPTPCRNRRTGMSAPTSVIVRANVTTTRSIEINDRARLLGHYHRVGSAVRDVADLNGFIGDK